MEEFQIMLGQEALGRAQVTRQGLYYQIRCRCRLTGDVLYRVQVSCGEKGESLGTLVPMGNEFGLDTRLAVKKLGEGELRFRLLPRHGELTGKFVPLAPEEPFQYISRLKNAFLENREGVLGIVLP